MELTENHIRYGIDHSVNQPPNDRDVVEVSEYRGEETLTINCTQLGDSYRPVLALRNLEHLTLRSSAREVKALHPELLELPHLKWGLIKEQPQLYRASKRA